MWWGVLGARRESWLAIVRKMFPIATVAAPENSGRFIKKPIWVSFPHPDRPRNASVVP